MCETPNLLFVRESEGFALEAQFGSTPSMMSWIQAIHWYTPEEDLAAWDYAAAPAEEEDTKGKGKKKK